MVFIEIKKAASYHNLSEIKHIFRGMNFTSVEITMDYDCSNGLPNEEDKEKWPFKARLVGTDDIYDVRIYSLSVGYAGTGPHNFAEILDFFKVRYDQDDIFTKQRMLPDGFIHLKFTR